jgi:hypothetical protein
MKHSWEGQVAVGFSGVIPNWRGIATLSGVIPNAVRNLLLLYV